MLQKKKLNQIDVKLLKGLFTRARNEYQPLKGINETFRPDYITSTPKRKSLNIVRKFKSFVLKDSIEEMSSKIRDKLSVLESIDEFLDQKEVEEI